MKLEKEDVESNPSLAVALFDQYKVEISALEKELDEKEEEHTRNNIMEKLHCVA